MLPGDRLVHYVKPAICSKTGGAVCGTNENDLAPLFLQALKERFVANSLLHIATGSGCYRRDKRFLKGRRRKIVSFFRTDLCAA